MKTTKRPGGLSFYVVLLAVIIVMSVIMSRMAQPAPIDLSKLISQIENGEVKEVMVNGYSIEVTMNKTETSAGVVYSKQVSPMWMSDLFSVLKQAQSDGKIESFDYDEPTDVAGWLNIILIIVYGWWYGAVYMVHI
jgi:ATP-dependent Zn protease